MPKQMTVNGQVFKSKKALLDKCKVILNSSSMMGPLQVDDATFIVSLIETYHPEASLKVGVGISKVSIQPDGYGGRCFWLERVDGSKTDVSVYKCVNHPSYEKSVKEAFRNAIAQDVLAFKARRLTEVSCCEYSGKPFDEIHVDHKPPKTFEFILNEFMKTKGLTWEQVAIDPTYDGKVGSWLSDTQLWEEWRSYHNSTAELRLVNKRANLGDIKKNCNDQNQNEPTTS
jgi:hypothetical protein